MNWLLTFLLIPYIFWGLITLSLIAVYACVHDEDEFHGGAGLLSLGLVALVLYRFDELRALAFSWPGGAYVVGGYLAAGLFVMGVKWLMVLVDFKERAGKWLKEHPEISERSFGAKRNELAHHLYGYRSNISRVEFEGPDSAHRTYYPNYRYFPLANWLTFWPVFSISVILDNVHEFAKTLVKWAGNTLERLAKRFSVS